MTRTLGLTGGIGSGKSYLAERLEKHYPVYYSDLEARNLVEFDSDVVAAIKVIFGDEIYHKNGLDRKGLAHIVFNDKHKLDQLNAIVHPAVRRHCDNWIKNQTSEISFVEAAILFETNRYKDFFKNVLVTAPRDIRIARVVHRDKVSVSDVVNRMDKQLDDDQKIPLADFVFSNTDDNFEGELKRLFSWLDSLT